MLNELDGISPLNNVVFLAATNRPDIIVRLILLNILRLLLILG